ncbi:MAG: hypothetical protein EOM48_09035 [Bacilli bacterium]|nr:hypothetical protein [Bacilli bacterium]
MEFEAKLHARQADAGLFAVAGIDWHAVNRKATGKAILYLEDRDKISDEQRKLLFALWREYETYTGVPLDAVEAWFKYEYMLHADLDGLPSVSRNGMSKHLATDFITFTLEYYLNNGIPFRQADWYKGADINRVCYAMLIKRICFVCGKEHSDVHHLNGSTVGMGNDREKVNHIGRWVACLCREDHGKIHTGGERAFFSKHHIVPIKLDAETVQILGL